MGQLTEEVEIIPAGTDNLEVMVDLRIQLLKEIGKLNKDDDLLKLKDKLYDYFQTNLNSGQFKAWLALVDEQVVATSGLIYYQVPPHGDNLQGKEAYIMNMYTVPEYRGQGIATQILAEIIDYAERENINKLWLRAEKEAKALYRRVDFKQSKRYMELKK